MANFPKKQVRKLAESIGIAKSHALWISGEANNSSNGACVRLGLLLQETREDTKKIQIPDRISLKFLETAAGQSWYPAWKDWILLGNKSKNNKVNEKRLPLPHTGTPTVEVNRELSERVIESDSIELKSDSTPLEIVISSVPPIPDRDIPPSTTTLDSAMRMTIAHTVKMFVDSGFDGLDRTIAADMVMWGLRRLHDRAKSKRGTGKYLGHGYWSKTAQRVLATSGGRVNETVRKKLRHEHVIPVKFFLDNILFSNEAGTPSEVYEQQITDFGIVAIITREESNQIDQSGVGRTMPINWEKLGVFARYKVAGIFDEIEAG